GALPGQTNAGSSDAFVRKYDSSGNVLWTTQFGTSSFDQAIGLALDASANVYVTGFVVGALPGQTSAGATDAFVRAYDSSGNILWPGEFGTASWDPGQGIAVDTTGVYGTGWASGALPGKPFAGITDPFVEKYDLNGNLLGPRQFGTSAQDQPTAVAADGAGS